MSKVVAEGKYGYLVVDADGVCRRAFLASNAYVAGLRAEHIWGVRTGNKFAKSLGVGV